MVLQIVVDHREGLPGERLGVEHGVEPVEHQPWVGRVLVHLADAVEVVDGRAAAVVADAVEAQRLVEGGWAAAAQRSTWREMSLGHEQYS